MHSAVISIGANIGERKNNIRSAILKMGGAGIVLGCSKPYRTRPYGKTDQPCFINMAVTLRTGLEPLELLNSLQKIENELGRIRTVRWGERTIDLDIIFYDSMVMSDERLSIPHPDIQNRYFVLKPLLDICPEFVHPVLKKTVAEMYKDLQKNN
ncbi:MAG: 2-amino-4-hydroxy-6-hydroxymethyldihydropteridine diphosphokinase [Brevinematales bacterium]|jgi:2-amino-4-hydroxy-6-hydroxymethyldihydropteridine diphosphokinase